MLCVRVCIVALSVSIHEAAVAGDKETLSHHLSGVTAAHLGYEAQVLLLREGFTVHS